ncbi:mitochondrial inner membrane protease subunit [Colletotrichum musicola]|uniref:Mitochondrial inner membrane protease subunit n=2 Tax=Colletotrichum orchidearum species complex TaxID=2707337 RepID=A0A8H6KRQ7_9PEZI|nr:mitochondrial inner membrane protease subunit [Colletotrichum musicola]KAF6842052.1 mitochondrial inner membrane protease subunit [Colletotrichum plurivorum]
MAFRSLWARARGSFLGDTTARLLGFATWIPVVIWFNEKVATVTKISGASMYPYFNEDRNSTLTRDLVLNWRWNAQDGLKKGMIVTFRSPYNPETVAVKRIIALEGEHVMTRPPHPHAIVRVPQGHIWVEGDGPADQTLDSNTYGPISMSLVTGKITWFLYPWRKFGSTKWRDYQLKPRY